MKICIVTSHRAERGLLQPLIDMLDVHRPLDDRVAVYETFDLDLLSLDPDADHVANYEQAAAHYMGVQPDVVMIPCDRAEALAGALAAFEMSIPIIHFHAGDVGTVSKDEVYRHMISIMASVHLCNGPSAKKVVCDLLKSVGRPVALVYDVGSTAMDDIEISESGLSDCQYDLVLYHPPTNDLELISRELGEIDDILETNIAYADGSAADMSNHPIFWIYPNGDPGSDIIIDHIEESSVIGERSVWGIHNLHRPSFLSMMKNCLRYIGNSSSMVCEAPVFLSEDQIIHIGDRNRNRSCDDINPGATDRIISILEELDGEQIW